ncbi:ATP-binding cassette domain-containing protein, partial [Listeria monocytogenes]|nr:ATP-binding cassette domain-containing protein [Listeria monocytogenes]
RVWFPIRKGVFRRTVDHVKAVDGVNFELPRGQTLGIVGESGSGKSVTAPSILRLLPYSVASHPAGSIHYQGEDLLKLPERRLRGIRGNRIAMVFPEPMTALNPLHT